MLTLKTFLRACFGCAPHVTHVPPTHTPLDISRRQGWATWHALYKEEHLLDDMRPVRGIDSRRKILDRSGIMLGKAHHGYVLDRSKEHVLLCGHSGSGKGASVVIPTLSTTWMDSAIVTDFRSETFHATAAWRATLGKVYFFNPTADDSAGYNPLDHIRSRDGMACIEEVRELAHVISSHLLVDEDVRQAGEQVLTAVILHVLHHEEGGGFMHLGSCLGALDPHHGPFYERSLYVEGAHIESVTLQEVRRVVLMLHHANATQCDAWLGFAQDALDLWRDPQVHVHTRRSDFNLEDLLWGALPSTLYICMLPHESAQCAPLLRMLLHQLTKLSTHHPEKVARRLLLMLDDVTQWPVFPSLLDDTLHPLPFRLCVSAHSLEIVTRMYGQDFLARLGIRLFCRPITDHCARCLCEHLPETSVPLLNRYEAQQMQDEEMVLWRRNKTPVYVTQARYYKDERLRARRDSLLRWSLATQVRR